MEALLRKAFEGVAPLSRAQVDAFCEYYRLLMEWNRRMNLTRITEPEEVARRHFADSASLLPHVPPGASLIDVGTGAGFPGIPLKILRPDITLTLLDSLNKRVEFLNAVLSQLGLEGQAVHARAEDAARTHLREAFDVACVPPNRCQNKENAVVICRSRPVFCSFLRILRYSHDFPEISNTYHFFCRTPPKQGGMTPFA